MSWDEDHLLPWYPQHIAQAFLAISYDDREMILEEELNTPSHHWIEEAIRQFAERWVGLDDAVFLRALREVQEQDLDCAHFTVTANTRLAHVTFW